MDATYSLMVESKPSKHHGPFQTIEEAREAVEKYVEPGGKYSIWRQGRANRIGSGAVIEEGRRPAS
jgi:hypothetical protein